MSIRAQLSWRARQGSQRIRAGSRRAAVTCCGDFATGRLVPLKLTFFVIMGATQCASPFNTLFFRALGMTITETAFIHALKPLLPIFAPLLGGLIADRLANFRVILVVTVALSGVVSLINFAVPLARETPHYNTEVSFDITCESSFRFTAVPESIKDCVFLNKTVMFHEMKVRDCGYRCPVKAIEFPDHLFKNKKKTLIKIHDSELLYHVCDLGFLKGSTRRPQKCYRVNKNESLEDENMPKSFKIHNIPLNLVQMNIPEHPSVLINNEDFTMSAVNMNRFECNEGTVPKETTLRKVVIGETIDIEEENELVTCSFHCRATVFHNQTCVEKSHSIEYNPETTFWMLVTSTVLTTLFISLSYTLFEISVISFLKEYGFDYRLQQVHGCVGGMIFAPITGLLIDYFAKDGEYHYKDYYVAFILYCCVKLLSAVMMTKLDLRFKRPTHSICMNICKIFRNIEMLCLMFVVTFAGMCYGFIESFLPWHLQDMGAKNWLIGSLTTVASLSAFPFLLLSNAICNKFGHVQALVFSLVCYSVRCIGYSLIVDPILSFAFEVFEGVTSGLLVAAAGIYGASLTPRGNVATVQGILAALHYGVGKSLGSLVGGFLMHLLNARHTFQIFSGISLFIAFAYYLILKFFLQPLELKRLKTKNEVMNMPIETISTLEHQRSLKRRKKAEQKRKEELAKKSFKKWRGKTTRAPTPTAENGKIVPDNSLITNLKHTDPDYSENGNVSILDETNTTNLNETQTTNLNETQMSIALADDSQVWENNSENEVRVSDMVRIENEITKHENQMAVSEVPMTSGKEVITSDDHEISHIPKEEVAISFKDEPPDTINISNDVQTQLKNNNIVEETCPNNNQTNYNEDIKEIHENNTSKNNYQPTSVPLDNNININKNRSDDNLNVKKDDQNSSNEENCISIKKENVLAEKENILDENKKSSQECSYSNEQTLPTESESETSEAKTDFKDIPDEKRDNHILDEQDSNINKAISDEITEPTEEESDTKKATTESDNNPDDKRDNHINSKAKDHILEEKDLNINNEAIADEITKTTEAGNETKKVATESDNSPDDKRDNHIKSKENYHISEQKDSNINNEAIADEITKPTEAENESKEAKADPDNSPDDKSDNHNESKANNHISEQKDSNTNHKAISDEITEPLNEKEENLEDAKILSNESTTSNSKK